MRTRLIALISGILIAALAAGAPAAELVTQKNSAGGVTVAITPQNFAAGAGSWDFKVVLDTHSQDLKDDLVKAVVLLDDRGEQHAPVKWEGAGPGGHHREGTLKFNVITPQPKSIELRIQRPGEVKPRSFSWQLQ